MTARSRLLAVLWAAGAVSVACNVLAAEPTLVGRMVAAWPPVALLLVVEVLARSTMPTGRVRWAAIGGAVLVAAVAAIASFHHMNAVALAAGESELVAWLFPLSVDGLAVVASVALLGTEPAPSPIAERHRDNSDLVDRHRDEIPTDLEPLPVSGSAESFPNPTTTGSLLRPLVVFGNAAPSRNGSGVHTKPNEMKES